MRLTTFLFISFVSLAGRVEAQVINTNRTMRSLTLEQCIQEALQHNLRLEIRRYDPNVNRYALAASYGLYYDPVFVSTYTRSFNSTPGRGFNPDTGAQAQSSTTDRDRLTPGLSGTLPWTGLKYDLGGDFTHSRGVSGGVNPFDDYTAEVDIQLTQPLLKNFWTDAGRLEIQLNKRNVRISDLALEEEVRQVVRDVELAYYELMFAEDDVKVQQKALELADALVAQNKEKVRVGTLAPLDARQAESRAATALADLIQAMRRLGTAEARLRDLITDSYAAWINTGITPSDKLAAVPEPLDLQESWRNAILKRPDYKSLLLEAEKQGILVKFRKNQLFPEFDVFGGYGRNGLDSSQPFDPLFPLTPAHKANLGNALDDISAGSDPKWNVGAVFRFPLSNKAERNRLRGAKEVEKQFQAQIKKLHQDIQVDIEIALGSAIGAYQRVSATRQARLYAEEALTAEQTKYDNGKSTPFQVLEVQRDLTKAKGDEIRALADYNESLTALFFRDGTLLDRRKITIKK
jgi:outer membrane protein TolC